MQLVEALHYKKGGAGFNSWKIHGNYQVIFSFYLHSVVLESTQPPIEMSTTEFPWG
jgi:hypothetical protein